MMPVILRWVDKLVILGLAVAVGWFVYQGVVKQKEDDAAFARTVDTAASLETKMHTSTITIPPHDAAKHSLDVLQRWEALPPTAKFEWYTFYPRR